MEHESHKTNAPGPAEDRPQRQEPAKGFKESIYDKIPLTVRQLDVIIIVLAVAFVVFLALGIWKGA